MTRNALQHQRTRYPGHVDDLLTYNPTGLSNLWGWWDASLLTGLVDNDLVTTFSDFSGNARHATSSGASRATYKTGIVNGLPVLRFNGAHYYDLGGATNLNEATLYVVWSRANAANNDYVIGQGATYSYLQYGTAWYYGNSASYTLAMAASTFMLKCIKYSGSTVSLYTNGTLNSAPASTLDLFLRYFGNASYALRGDIAEIIVFSAALSDTDRQFIEAYLNTKYALW